MTKKVIVFFIILSTIIAGLYIGINDNNYLASNLKNTNLTNSGENFPPFSGEAVQSNDTLSGEQIPNYFEEIIELKSTVPTSIKAVYSTGWVMGTPSLRTEMIKSIKDNGFNAVVLDIKDESGRLSYKSSVQTAINVKAYAGMISDISSVIEELKANDIYVIGRIVTFKDPLYASKVNDIAYKKSDGSIWTDYNGNNWPNPYNNASWDYPIALAKEAAELGFQEIQFDYIRFPSSEGSVKNIAFGFDSATKTKSQAINSFLEKVMIEMEEYDVEISADIFGITTKRDGDFENIGQDFAKISTIVDVVCPMVYPSHYGYNEYGVSRPDKNPYKIIYHSLDDGLERFESYKNKHSGDSIEEISFAKIRPYYQDFTASWLGKGNYLSYGTNEVKEQIQAGYDLGIEDFCLWDPSNKYCYSALNQIVIKAPESLSGETIISGEELIILREKK